MAYFAKWKREFRVYLGGIGLNSPIDQESKHYRSFDSVAGMEQCETIHQDEAQLVRTSLERMMNLM